MRVFGVGVPGESRSTLVSNRPIQTSILHLVFALVATLNPPGIAELAL